MCDLSTAISPASHGVPGWSCHEGHPIAAICIKNISSWGGVNCSANGEITRIYLRYRGLTGTIPSSIGNIMSLTYFSLGFNNIYGRIPTELGLLAKLTFLGLSNNFLSGPLPSTLGLLSQMTQLSLYQNNINGTLPPEISKLAKVTVMALARNKISGSIPSSYAKLTNLYVITVGGNSLTGTIPTFFGSMKRLIMLGLLNNNFIGTIPSELSLIPNLQILNLNNNYLSGTIPSWFSKMFSLQNLCLSVNQLTGTIPASIGNLSNLMYFLIDSNLITGSIPSSITNMRVLQLLDLSHNNLIGTIPKFKSSPSYQFVRLNDNQLRGSLDNVFYGSSTLKFLDVSNNQLSGNLPTDIFSAPNLQVFAAAGNCLYTSLPREICLASSLSVLALDGLHASPYCDRTLSYYSYGGSAGIPTCLFGMSSLEVLHLSGNGLSGTLPDVLLVSPTLVDLTLSHNLLRGTIPFGIQRRVWNTLDLSFNKLGGTILDEIPVSTNGSFTLMINRLSGYIPSSLNSATNISILRGNVFACKFNTRKLPANDPAESSYSCGSDQLQLSFYLWSFVPLIITVSTSFLLLRRWITWEVIVKLLHEFWADIVAINNSSGVLSTISEIQRLCVVISFVLILLLLPLYFSLELQYCSHTYRYAWTVSAAFLSGIVPAVVLLVIWLLIVVVVYILLKKNRFAQNVVLPDVHTKRARCRDWFRVGCCSRNAVLGLILQLIINIAFVLPINAVYVYTAVTVNTADKLVLQLLLGLFKIAWGGIFVKNIGRLQRLITVKEDNNIFTDTVTTTVILISNAIVIPIIAQAAVDPSCFFTLLFPPPPVSVSYSYGQICWNSFVGVCSYLQVDLVTKYSPPFAYSYQCSSALLVNYSSVFVYMFLVIFLWTFIKLALSKLESGCPSCFRWIIYQDIFTGESTFNFPVYISTCMCYVVILLTFGVTYPPLGVVICVTVVLDTLVTHHIVKSSLEEEEDGSARMMAVVLNVIYLVPVFYGGFLLDMVGDESGGVAALWAPIVMFCIPLCYVAVDRAMNLYCYNEKEINVRHSMETPNTDQTPKIDNTALHEELVDVSSAVETILAERC